MGESVPSILQQSGQVTEIVGPKDALFARPVPFAGVADKTVLAEEFFVTGQEHPVRLIDDTVAGFLVDHQGRCEFEFTGQGVENWTEVDMLIGNVQPVIMNGQEQFK
jgi:hypothetical protein